MKRTNTQNDKSYNKYKGILYILAAGLCFAFMNLFVKLAGDVPAIQKSFFRNIVAVFFAFSILTRKKIKFHIPGPARKYVFMRCFVGTLGVFANFYAIGKLVIADASMLNKLSPFFAILFSFILVKEKPKLYQITCVITAFIGAMFILKPGFDSLASVPALIGLFGGACAGFAYSNLRAASNLGTPGPLIVFCFSLFSCLSALPFIIFNYSPMTSAQLASLLMAGLSATGGQFSITAAYTHAPASEISVYDYVQIIFAAILGMIFLNEMPDIFSIIGYIIIITAGVVMFFYEKKFLSPTK